MNSPAQLGSTVARYSAALAITAAAVFVRWILNPVLGTQLPFSFVFLTVLACARFFGMGPSLLAVVAGGVASIVVTGEQRVLAVGTFFLASSTAVWIIGALRRANRQAQENARLAAERLEELRQKSMQSVIEERQSAQLRAIVESSEDAIISKDLTGKIQSWNGGAEKTFGFMAAEAIGKPISMLIPAGRIGEEDEILTRIRAGERVKPFETMRLHKDGRQIPVSVTISPIRDAAGNISGASHISRDISEQKAMEEQLRETTKLESLGVLAGGLAHDFNNLLTGIMGNASLIVDDPQVHIATRRRSGNILDASERAAELVRQMLAYAGKARINMERVDLSALIEEFLPLLRSSIPRPVQLDLALSKNLPPVEADRSQMQQLITNLTINAAEAMEDFPGTVTLNTEVRENVAGRQVVVEVRDSGCGMNEETLTRIFDPFYTTKFTGRGLGLAAARGIVRAHRGEISVRSRPGGGSTFTVFLPAVAEPASARVEEIDLDTKGYGTVLVVDDEDLIRNMARHTLERCGYTVEVAPNGQTAVETFSARPADFAAVLLDLTMPVMDGEEALRHIQGIRPNVAVVLSSGYSEAEAVRRFRDRGLCGFLQKPYTATSLARKIKQAVGHRGADYRSAG